MDLSINKLYNAYIENKDKIDNYLKLNRRENFESSGEISPRDAGKILGFGIGIFIFILLISLAIWIWALVVLIKYWDKISEVGKIFGIIGVIPLVPFGPIITLIAVYATKSK